MPDGRARARPEISKTNTRLAQRRLEARLTQKQMAQLTGMSVMTYRRLERAELENPPLRHLVNCMLVLRSRLPHIRLSDVFEPQWLEWLPLSADAPAPPQPPKRERYKLFPD
jgi:transcriptional regulator with XRE-family HTH domain